MKEGSTVTVPARASAILPVLTAWPDETSRFLISPFLGLLQLRVNLEPEFKGLVRGLASPAHPGNGQRACY
jgi:hypothetical protein